MTDHHFSFAALVDVDAIAALIERAYRGPTAARGWTNESEILTGPRSSAGEIEGLILDPQTRFIVAKGAGGIVGCVLIQKLGDGAYFGMFAIDPDVQGGGLGKALVARAATAARELWAARYLQLTVISLRAPLIDWYERRGFVQTGEREPFPFDRATGALRTDFDLVVLQKPL
jgi:ribosomal protein S18 acetylase RimI-like enzyme